MQSRRALCVSHDEAVRRDVGDTLAAAGYAVDACASWPVDAAYAALVVVDRATRQAAGDALSALSAPVVVVGDNLDDDALVTLMQDAPVSHLVEDPRDRDLEITSMKLASGDLFGLEKYLAPGTCVEQREVATNGDRRIAIDQVSAWAETGGARRPLIHRMANVVDELLMNALVDAAVDTGVGVADRPPAVLRYGRDDRAIAISVGDRFGSLSQRAMIENILRARQDRGRPQTESASQRGAGLGLYFVLANVGSLIANVDPGRRTEVVCMFELVHRERRPAISRRPRSLHVFAADVISLAV